MANGNRLGHAIFAGLGALGTGYTEAEKQKQALQMMMAQRALEQQKADQDKTSDLNKLRLQALEASRRKAIVDPSGQTTEFEGIDPSVLNNAIPGLGLPSNPIPGYSQVQFSPKPDTAQKNAEQDRLENQAMQRLASLRGDTSLRTVEGQRDASISAYNTVDRIKSENRLPSKLEYYDLLGQMWKARTGASPTDQAIKDLDSSTFKGDISKAFTYISGTPAGATTTDVLNNIQDFAKSSGLQADKLHAGYMQSHLLKPQGLEDSRWNPIAQTSHGISFSNAVVQPITDTPQAESKIGNPSRPPLSSFHK